MLPSTTCLMVLINDDHDSILWFDILEKNVYRQQLVHGIMELEMMQIIFPVYLTLDSLLIYSHPYPESSWWDSHFSKCDSINIANFFKMHLENQTQPSAKFIQVPPLLMGKFCIIYLTIYERIYWREEQLGD